MSVNNPTSGTNGGNKYDLSTAIGQVPEELRVAGMKVSFLNSSGKPESWKYQGGSWAVASFIKEADGGNKILTWVTDAATTRKQVGANERKAGMQISYNPMERIGLMSSMLVLLLQTQNGQKMLIGKNTKTIRSNRIIRENRRYIRN